MAPPTEGYGGMDAIMSSPPSFGTKAKPLPSQMLFGAKPDADNNPDQDSFVFTRGPSEPFRVASLKAPAASPVTPQPAVSDNEVESPPSATVPSVLLWTDPLRSGLFFVGGLLCFAVTAAMLYGNHKVTFVAGLAYVAMVVLTANFFKVIATRCTTESSLWNKSAFVNFLSSRCALVIDAAAALHDNYLLAADPNTTFQVALTLWVLSAIGSLVSFGVLALVGYLAIFSIPAILHHCHSQVKSSQDAVKDAVEGMLRRFNLGRRHGMATAMLTCATLFFFMTWTNVAIMTFVMMTYLNVLAKPAEIERLRAFTHDPIMASARKIKETAGRAHIDDLVTRFSAVNQKPHLG